MGVHEFFSFNFPLREYIFFVLRPPPPISFLMVRPLASAYMKNVDPFVLANGACACSDCLPLTELSHSCPPSPPARFETTWPKKATCSRDENGVGSARGG